ncbi:hypothetical protein YC2023_098302 [Brassica napus]
MSATSAGQLISSHMKYKRSSKDISGATTWTATTLYLYPYKKIEHSNIVENT